MNLYYDGLIVIRLLTKNLRQISNDKKQPTGYLTSLLDDGEKRAETCSYAKIAKQLNSETRFGK